VASHRLVLGLVVRVETDSRSAAAVVAGMLSIITLQLKHLQAIFWMKAAAAGTGFYPRLALLVAEPLFLTLLLPAVLGTPPPPPPSPKNRDVYFIK
jgi:hypothetical protein